MNSHLVTYPIAFLAGVVSFLSPCVLPLVPGYLAWMSGVGVDEIRENRGKSEVLWKVFRASVAFVAGFTLIFVILGASASTIGVYFRLYQQILTQVAGVIIVLFGLFMMGVLKIPAFFREYRFQGAFGKSGVGGSFIAGLAFAFGWTPCVGPILGVILALAATEQSVVQGAALLSVYSLGLGVPFILAGLAMNAFLGFFNFVKKYLHVIEVTGGALLVVMGLLVFTGQIAILSSKLSFINPEALIPMNSFEEAPAKVVAKTPASGNFARYDFTVEDLEGKPVSLHDFTGKYVLLNFWAPWCPPCREEMPGFEKIYQQYKGQGFVIWGVGVSTTPAAIRKFAEKVGVTYPLAYDRTGKAARKYGVRGIPSSFLFGPDGSLLQTFMGYVSEDELIKIVQKYIR